MNSEGNPSEKQIAEESFIKSIDTFIDKFGTLDPTFVYYLELLKEKKEPFEIYKIRNDSLNENLEGTGSQASQIQKNIEFEEELIEKLKIILVSANVSEETYKILKNGDFNNTEDLSNMEREINAFFNTVTEYDIQIVKQAFQELKKVQREFLERFVLFLEKLLVSSESNGELTVHKSLYMNMRKFKFIYKFSKDTGFYKQLCDAYKKKSKSLYTHEFSSHIRRISELIKDNQSLIFTIDSLFRSYKSLLECEIDFLKLMDIELDIDEIFSNVNLMILDFLDSFFKKSAFCVLISICKSKDNFALGGFSEMLLDKYKVLEDIFLSTLRETKPTFEYAIFVNLLVADPENCNDLLNCIKLVVYQNIKDKTNNNTLENIIANLQIIYSIKESDTQGISNELRKRMSPLLLEYLRGKNKDPVRLFNHINMNKQGADKTKAVLKEMILENCGEDSIDSVRKLLSGI